MKKIGFLFAALALTVAANAQEKTANEYKNEGNELMKAKKYQQALESYEQAYAIKGDSLDLTTVYNAGYCAMKADAYDKAITFFNKAEANASKADACCYNAAQCLKKQEKTEEYIAALQAGIQKYTSGKYNVQMKKELTKYYRDKALASYNEATEVTKQFAANVANQDKLDELKAEAKAKCEEALPNLEKALEVSPTDAACSQVKTAIEKLMSTL